MIDRTFAAPPVRHPIPSRGWPLLLLLALFLLPGLLGHDPWKTEDATHLGMVWRLLQGDGGLNLYLGNDRWPDAMPLYYWTAALTAKGFSWLLPWFDAARLATALYAALAFGFLALASRELHGREESTSAPLLMAGCIGLLAHIHEAQPAIAFLAAQSACLAGLALLHRLPWQGAALFGVAAMGAFLAAGLAALPGIILPLLLLPLLAPQKRQLPGLLLLTLGLAILMPLLWPLLLGQREADQWLAGEIGQLRSLDGSLHNAATLANMLPWYAWPALPLALWALWARRKEWLNTSPAPALVLPLAAFAASFLTVVGTVDAKSVAALPLLPPLALLGAGGIRSLRRGAANLFDWFGMMTFTFAAGLLWLGWCAMVFGVPPKIAHNFAKLAPGFEGSFFLPAALFALVLTGAWGWLIYASPRSPYRGLTHWTAGITLMWGLVAALWFPWVDYGKTYRPVVTGLSRALPQEPGCIALKGELSPALKASLDIFGDIRPLPLGSSAGQRCNWLLALVPIKSTGAAGSGWERVWDGSRPGDKVEHLRLYQRRGNKPAPAISAVPEGR